MCLVRPVHIVSPLQCGISWNIVAYIIHVDPGMMDPCQIFSIATWDRFTYDGSKGGFISQ